MTLLDTSAWIEFLRDTGSPTCEAVDRLLGTKITICAAVQMEILAGARDEAHLRDLRGLLARATMEPTQEGDYEEAAALFRTCRRQGETVRKLIDCLIAAIAIRISVPVLHLDSDFDTIARHTPLEIHSLA
jgi:predicted nucleic acid-binding protein